MNQPSVVQRMSIRRIRQLMELLDNAEFDENMRLDALRAINFLPRNQEYIQKSRQLFARIERFITPLRIAIYSVLAYLLVASVWDWSIALVFSQVVLAGYVLLIGYHQWIRAECNRNVEDAIARKAELNEVIKANINLLYPYVGKVFGAGIEYRPEPVEMSSRTLIDMYIFSELDNLEFIFQKAKFGLVYPEFAFRAVKIFIARAENEKFAQRSGQLVISGRYNDDFQELVNELIHIALYRREALS